MASSNLGVSSIALAYRITLMPVRVLVSDRAWFQLHLCGREYHPCDLQPA